MDGFQNHTVGQLKYMTIQIIDAWELVNIITFVSIIIIRETVLYILGDIV